MNSVINHPRVMSLAAAFHVVKPLVLRILPNYFGIVIIKTIIYLAVVVVTMTI